MELHVTNREVFGKKVNTIRKQWLVPGIVYGKHLKSPVAIQFDKNTFIKLYKQTGESTPIDLIGDNKELVLVHHIDTDPVTSVVLHVDLLAVKANEKVKAPVSIVLVGVAPAEKEGIGKVQLVKDHVMVEAFPRDLPHNIEIDISRLATLQDGIFVSDITVSAKVEILDDAELPIVAVVEIADEVEETTGSGDAAGNATAAAMEAEKGK